MTVAVLLSSPSTVGAWPPHPSNAASLIIPLVLDNCFVLLDDKLSKLPGAASSAGSSSSSSCPFGSGLSTCSWNELVRALSWK
jgi:hypothetical protein